ncbi:hypothetical protein EPUL_004741 [Erysiphe pulchra]|uniref:Protein disulfide-isomerase n=1 Tax=Erysiphe pulchra TaxID=225359 RepID=A0A2S4PNS1_9PEZI|nr:hypothetical protein EPUL_004741 [Erysiphe pulchra]
MYISLKLALSIFSVIATSTAFNVVSLSNITFPGYIKQNDLVLVDFYAPWCTESKLLAPEFEQAASKLVQKKIRLVKVDCVIETILCDKHNIYGYPVLKIFRGINDVKLYTGPQKAPEMAAYMVRQSLPALSIMNKDSIEDLKKVVQVVLVAYFDAKDKISNSVYTETAGNLRENYLFGVSHDPILAENEGVTFPAVVLYKSFDEGKAIHSGKIDADEIEKFIINESTPLIGDMTYWTFNVYMRSSVPLAYIFTKTRKDQKLLKDTLRPIAKKYKGRVKFVNIDSNNLEALYFDDFLDYVNLKADKFPAFAIQETNSSKQFSYDQDKEITAESIDNFIFQYINGKLVPNIKSEPIPEYQNGSVKVVVAENFDEIVINNDKDVVVEFYGSMCKAIKAFAPKYDALGQLYKDKNLTDKVTIAKIDASANDVTQNITEYPTIMLFKAGDKKNPITYDGDQEIEELVAFVKQGNNNVSIEYTVDLKN